MFLPDPLERQLDRIGHALLRMMRSLVECGLAPQAASLADLQTGAELVQDACGELDELATAEMGELADASAVRDAAAVIKINAAMMQVAYSLRSLLRRIEQMARVPGYHSTETLNLLARHVVSTFRDALRAARERNVELAQEIISGNGIGEALYSQIAQELMAEFPRNIRAATVQRCQIGVAKCLERISDHCATIAESVIECRRPTRYFDIDLATDELEHADWPLRRLTRGLWD